MDINKLKRDIEILKKERGTHHSNSYYGALDNLIEFANTFTLTAKESSNWLVKELRDSMSKLGDAERLDIIEKVAEGYCIGCGTGDIRCQCWNDD